MVPSATRAIMACSRRIASSPITGSGDAPERASRRSTSTVDPR
jgi:hypothetical protein